MSLEPFLQHFVALRKLDGIDDRRAAVLRNLLLNNGVADYARFLEFLAAAELPATVVNRWTRFASMRDVVTKLSQPGKLLHGARTFLLAGRIDKAQSAMVCAYLDNMMLVHDTRETWFIVDSRGGEVYYAKQICYSIEAAKQRFTIGMYVPDGGHASSCASLIVGSASMRVAHKRSTMLIHQPKMNFEAMLPNYVEWAAKKFLCDTKDMDLMYQKYGFNRIGGILSLPEVDEHCPKTAYEAQSYGIIDEIDETDYMETSSLNS